MCVLSLFAGHAGSHVGGNYRLLPTNGQRAAAAMPDLEDLNTPPPPQAPVRPAAAAAGTPPPPPALPAAIRTPVCALCHIVGRGQWEPCLQQGTPGAISFEIFNHPVAQLSIWFGRISVLSMHAHLDGGHFSLSSAQDQEMRMWYYVSGLVQLDLRQRICRQLRDVVRGATTSHPTNNDPGMRILGCVVSR